MTEWKKRIFAMNLTVGDLERSKTFYREVFDLLPLNEEKDWALFRFTDMYVMLRHDPAHQAPSAEAPGLALRAGSGLGAGPGHPEPRREGRELSALRCRSCRRNLKAG